MNINLQSAWWTPIIKHIIMQNLEVLKNIKQKTGNRIFTNLKSRRGNSIARIRRSNRLVLNISGEIYETLDSTLARFPTTLLGDAEKRGEYYNAELDQYVIYCNRMCFDAILFFYQSCGMLCCPMGMPVPIFERECRFFQLPDKHIEDMVRKALNPPSEVFKKCKRHQPCSPSKRREPSCLQTSRWKLWDILEHTEPAPWIATVLSGISSFFIFAYIIIDCRRTVHTPPGNPGTTKDVQNFKDPWYAIEFIVNVWFLVELLLGLSCTPDKLKFFKTPMRWIDAISVLPYFLVVSIPKFHYIPLGFLRILRTPRALRLLPNNEETKELLFGLDVLRCTIVQFKFLWLCLGILCILGAAFIYFIECEKNPDIESILHGLWWSIITVVTVGYGDVIPTTKYGQLFAAFYMGFGVMTVSVMVLILLERSRDRFKSFETFENYLKEKEELESGSKLHWFPSFEKLKRILIEKQGDDEFQARCEQRRFERGASFLSNAGSRPGSRRPSPTNLKSKHAS